MKNKLKNIFKILVILFIIFGLNISLFATEESANINWEKAKISKVYNKSTKKLIFLVQFKTTKKPNIDYDYYFKILTNKRKRTCEGKFIYNGAKTIYATCSVIIGDIKTLDKKISLNFEVEDPENHENQIVVNRNYNIFDNIYSFDWILDTDNISEIKTPAQVVDLDVLDTPKTTVEKLKKQGKIVIGYINVGAIENYRDDYEKFPKNVIGKTYSGWEDEKYLDIRKYEKFQKFILNRLDIAKEKGFDGIEPDNMDTYDNFEETGFEILQGDMKEYLTWLNIETNKRGMFLIQKNAPELSQKMEKNFDAALLEGAFYNNFEDDFQNYVKNGKKVFNVEYTDNTSKKYFLENICPKSKKIGFISILKNRNLDKFIVNCPEKNLEKKENKNYSEKVHKLTKIEIKLKNILEKFYSKLDKKYSDKNKKIKILEKIKSKIKKIKLKKQNNKKLLNILNYIEYSIGEKIFVYKYQLFEETEDKKLQNKNILLKTDFSNVFLDKKISDPDGVWWQRISGKNMNLMGYDTQLQFIVDGEKDINKYAKTEIISTIGKDNKQTKALHLEIIKKEQEDTQIPLITYTDGKEIEELNIKYSLKFPKNLSDKLGKDGWAVISEYKTTGDFRLAIYVYSDENKKLYWYIHGDNVVDEPKNYKEFWFKQNKQIEIPVGEWFDVDIFWKRGISDGEVVFKIDNKKVLEYYGKTKIKDNINAIMYFTNYASSPIDIWIDNFEVSGKNAKQKLIPKKDKIYFGAFQEFGGGETEVSKEKLENFEKLIGKKPAWAYFSQDFAEEGIKFPKQSVEKIISFGEIPFIRLMPSMVYEHNKKTYNLKAISSGEYDKELRTWAKEAKKINSPLFLDFAVEMNGNWFFYSGNPELYKKAYRHIIDIFREENVNNVTWFFHVNMQSFPNSSNNKPKNYYPGDEYIDWIGFSLYGTQNPIEKNIDFKEKLKENYKDILDISDKKPIALLEFGVADFNTNFKKEIWLENTFKTILGNPYIKFSAISMWSEKWEEEAYYSDLRIQSSEKSLEIYKKYLNKNIFENNLLFSK